MELYIVHEAPLARHLSDVAILSEARSGRIISDAAAQTIAAWWHSPDSPLSTVLSTMGKVDVRMTRETFVSDTEFGLLKMAEQDAVNALVAYIRHHISAAPSGARRCAVEDCLEFGVVYGIVGAICSSCEESGCEAGETCECEPRCDCDVLALPPGRHCEHDPVGNCD